MQVRVWDPLVRICHWGIVLLLPLCWYSAEQGEMEQHQTFAYLLAALLLARLGWGLFGSETARFSHFVRSPMAVVDYFRRWHQPRQMQPGHNPAGGYMVLFMWAVLLLQWGTGLFASDDILTEGPLYATISESLASQLMTIHRTAFYWLVGAVVLHVVVIMVYRLRGVALVPPMLHGRMMLQQPLPIKQRSTWLALVWLAVWLGGFGWFLIWPLWSY